MELNFGRRGVPLEILELVFENLKPGDRKTCLLVCRSWLAVLQRFFQDISIGIPYNLLPNLSKDISIFADKVNAIKLYKPEDSISNPSYSLALSNIVKQCPNLTLINFAFPYAKEFLEVLDSSAPKLNHIQNINIYHNDSSHIIHKLLLKISLRYCETITSLNICNLEFSLWVLKYTSFPQLLSKFPKLTHLKADNLLSEPDSKLDICQILKASPHLQQLKLYGIFSLTSNSQSICTITEPVTVRTLKVEVQEMDIKTLKYIITHFKQVNHLRLKIINLIPDDSLPERESRKILNDLQAYGTRMRNVTIKYIYKGDYFCYEPGRRSLLPSRERPILDDFTADSDAYLTDDPENSFLSIAGVVYDVDESVFL